ncbi:ABC transporter ATP-binding protein [Bradyrhizobium sp. SYSU BS000235]|uniref:ABC transporter ATP-binding protein n=1 Tax=Bradyrhizobium sp. SYSU BS000235 TaxID=3411332 RepID=UPI003C787AF3
MSDLCGFADRPKAFLLRYVARRKLSHALILGAVLTAVACSVSTQYGVKLLVDALTAGPDVNAPWTAFLFLVSLIAADNFSWRVASWTGSYTFVHVTGDLRRDLFRHITDHSPSFFSNRLPGVLTSRVTATSNAVFTVENMFFWNVLPPCLATAASITFLLTVNWVMAITLMVVAAIAVVVMFKFAARGRPLHHDFARKAARVDGEMVDVVGNMALVKAFSGMVREHFRFDQTVDRELHARRRSLLYLEKLRLGHALVTVVLTLTMLAWAISLWQQHRISAGDVILVCTLGISILSATRDLAVALVDVTQHMARLSESLSTLLVPHQLRDMPEAVPLVHKGAAVAFERVKFQYPGGRHVFKDLSLNIQPGERVGLIGPSGGGKSTLVTLLQRFYDVDGGRILIDGQDVAHVTQNSLRQAISTVPQDTALFNRSLLENIRYGRPEATDEEVAQAAEAARCSSFISKLPLGFETIVGDRGLKLSGGQRQRISIARAFLKNAPILVLDEATSALDTEVEEAIRDALAHLMEGRTVIAIAHRLSTLRNFDRILVMKDGQLIEDGPPEILLSRNGAYRKMVDREVGRLATRAA